MAGFDTSGVESTATATKESLFLISPQNFINRLLASSCLPVRPSVCPHTTTQYTLSRFSLSLAFGDF